MSFLVPIQAPPGADSRSFYVLRPWSSKYHKATFLQAHCDRTAAEVAQKESRLQELQSKHDVLIQDYRLSTEQVGALASAMSKLQVSLKD